MAATLKATTMLGAAVSGARPAGLKAALPIRRRSGVVRVANIAAPAEELLGKQPQSTQPRFEVRLPSEDLPAAVPCPAACL